MHFTGHIYLVLVVFLSATLSISPLTSSVIISPPKMFACPNCAFTTEEIVKFVSHQSFHRNVPHQTFVCCITTCGQKYRTYCGFKSHMLRKHVLLKDARRHSSSQGLSDRMTNTTEASLLSENTKTARRQINLNCCLQHCVLNFHSVDSLISHLKVHISSHEEIECPFKTCNRKFSKKSTFSAHLSRKHTRTKENLKCLKRFSNVAETLGESANLDLQNEHTEGVEHTEITQVQEPCSQTINNDLVANDFVVSEETYSDFIKSLATFYLKLQSKYLLPVSVIQNIISEFQLMHEISSSIMQKDLQNKMRSFGLSDDTIANIIDEVSVSDLFSACNKGPLKTEQRRKTYYRQNFAYNEPRQVFIGYDDNNKTRSFQYIPISESISTLYKYYPTHFVFHSEDTKTPNENMLFDVHQGRVFKDNPLFTKEARSFQIILYQDAFEVVNPLGSARKKHKLVGVYFTLANFEAYKRSNIDHMQLVLLCYEKDLKLFGTEKVFREILQDIKMIESKGLNVGPQRDEVVKGTLFCILGDNLGSHMIGGFVESFSATYFCRYCCITKHCFQESVSPQGVISRTVENYKDCVSKLGDNIQKQSHMGIKQDSIFNTLAFYHVANPGLPPCLGHDLFEGIVSYDLALMICYFVEIQWFSYAKLERIMTRFSFHGKDALDKPPILTLRAEKLIGHAVQNWVFLRMLPLLIGKYVQNTDDDVWQLYLCLKVIVEYVCSPQITIPQIAYLKVCIEEYLQRRMQLFPTTPLRPKHHFLSHYPELILAFGPLINLWTLRFESKHSYFKQCARKLHNYKHLIKTLACKHQLLQAFYSCGSLFPQCVSIIESIPFNPLLCNPSVQECLRGLHFSLSNTKMTMKVQYKGNSYEPGTLIIIDNNSEGIRLGETLFMLVKHEILYFVVSIIQTHSVPAFGVYAYRANSNQLSESKCIAASEVYSLFPVPAYLAGGVNYISLKNLAVSE